MISGLDAYRATGAALALPYYFGLLGKVLVDSGRPAEAGDALNKALSVAEKSHDRCYEAELHRLKGELALSQRQNLETAERHFRRSIEIAKKQRSKAWELRATTSLARLYQSQKRHAEGRDMLSDVYSTFSQGLRTPDLQDAQRLLAELRLPG